MFCPIHSSFVQVLIANTIAESIKWILCCDVSGLKVGILQLIMFALLPSILKLINVQIM